MCDLLFNIDNYKSEHPDAASKKAKGHVWTKNKAQFIAEYLKRFTYVTKHGTYLDAFAGPQTEAETEYDNWAARLVLKNEPKRLRRFHLFEKEKSQIQLLKKLAEKHHEPGELKKHRKVCVHSGDVNTKLPAFLQKNPIAEKEAAFCLFDQRTKECDWKTVEAVARHKTSGNKIELFYFLVQAWIDRILTEKLGSENVENVIKWLGCNDWKSFKKMNTHDRAKFFSSRFKDKFGYNFSNAYPIYEHGAEGKIMFWMIHASDHERAPALMDEAYSAIGLSSPENKPIEQLSLFDDSIEE